ncbi:MAG: ATP-binding protein [Thermoflexales bacterium]
MDRFEAVLRTSAHIEQLTRIRDLVCTAARHTGFEGVHMNHVELAVEEACMNIINHAYARRDGGYLEVQVRSERGRRLTIVLIDCGQSFDPASACTYDPSQPLEGSQQVGFGLYLMRCLMDELKFEFGITTSEERCGGQPFNRLTMVKNL